MAEETPQPLHTFRPVQQEVQRLFRELIHQPWGGKEPTTQQAWQPSVDMCETDKAIIVEVELPGVRREDIRIEVEGEVLRITGERRATTTTQQGRNYFRVEQHYGQFQRQLRLPRSVNREAIEAEFEAGVLTLTLPKGA